MELAIFSRQPAFEQPQYVGTPLVEDDLFENYARLVEGVFERRYFTNNGPLVQELEGKIAQRHKVRHCIIVCNATIAQMLVLKALELTGEIILPSFTFIATAHACLWQNATPVFCDISPDDLMINPEEVKRLITPRTCAVIGVHIFGNVCDVEALTAICQKHNLRLVFDAAHAFDCTLDENPVGRFGDAEFLSFHATKFFSTFEGGAVLTNNRELARRLHFLRNFGFRGYDDIGFLGVNGKMPEASAALGLASLSKVDTRIKLLKHNHELYRKELQDIPGVRVLPIGTRGRSNYHYMVVVLDPEVFGVSRDMLDRVLWEERVFSRRYFYPGCHNMEYFKNHYPEAGKNLEITERIARQVLCLPTNLTQPERDIPMIASIIRNAHSQAERVNEWVTENRSTL